MAAGLALLCACAPGGDGPTEEHCQASSLPTLDPGTLTLATEAPAFPPWFLDDSPESGEGFESALGYAVADRLGYEREQVRWVRVPFNTAMAPGAKAFDAAIDQFSITEQRRQIADFSSPYYDIVQAVVTVAGTDADAVTSRSGLAALRLGAVANTTGAGTARALSAAPITVYENTVESMEGLRAGQVDALVADLPTARTLAGEIPGGIILGRLPSGTPEQLGILLDLGSPLTRCVSEAVDGIRDDGTLAELQRRWMPEIPARELE
ncbi:hypothetical protein MBRU_12510 [Mycolicibacterium brumae DSM 44177]|nr:hypothetical protein MBRU_12510 [Mycolicibacterium brumae DSM 44177]